MPRIFHKRDVPASGTYIPDTYWLDPSRNASVVFGLTTDCDGTFYAYQYSTAEPNKIVSTLTYSITRNVREVHRIQITSPFVRFRFDYTGTCQSFDLDVLSGNYSQLTTPNNLVVQQDSDSIVVRPTEYVNEVALSKRSNEILWNKFGYNGDVDIGTEVIAAFGGTFTYLTSASTLTLVSSSANDTNGGTGAHAVVLYGIDANRLSQTEVVFLTGVTPVVTTTTWLGLNRVALYLSGSGQVNEGNITITATTGGSNQAYIPEGQGTTQQLIFFTQANHTALASWLVVSGEKLAGGATPKFTFKGWVYSAVSNSKYEVFRQVLDTSVEGHIQLIPKLPFVIGEKSVFWIEVTTDKDDSIASGRFSLIEIKTA